MAKLPSAAVLSKRSTAALIRTLARFGLVVDKAWLEERVAMATAQLAAAAAPDAALAASTVEAVKRAGRLAAIRDLREYVRTRRIKAQGGGKAGKFVWVAIGGTGDTNTCSSCIARNGVKKTMKEWEREGLPGSDNLQCDGRCRCDLLKADMVDEDTTRGEIRVEVDIEVSE